MIYFYHGPDSGKSRAAVRAAVDALRARAPEASIETVTDEVEQFDADLLLHAQGLFYQKRIVVLDGLMQRADIKEVLVPLLPALAASEHVFFIVEGDLLPQTAKMVAKHAQKAVQSGTKVAKTKDDAFKLADALQLRDRRLLWVELARRLEAGTPAEELHGMLFWAAKGLALASVAQSPEDSGLHPFVYRKAAARAKQFSPEEIRQLVRTLAALPHEARRRGAELEYELERFALSFA